MATNDVLDRLEALLAAATPGPWHRDPLYWSLRIVEKSGADVADGLPDDTQWPGRDDADYICALHHAAPALIRLARAVLAVDDWTTKTDHEMKLADNEKADAVKALGEVRL